MYICICNQVTESQLRKEIEHGATTVRQLRNSLGVTNQCGKCGDCVKQCVKEHKDMLSISERLIPTSCSA